jgi:hypothetical protein
MSRPLFAVTAISAFGLSFITTSLVSTSYGSGHEDLGERAAIILSAVVPQYSTSRENKHKYGWKEYGCFDKMVKDLQLIPMWCNDAWNDPIYLFASEDERSEQWVSHSRYRTVVTENSNTVVNDK